MVLLSGAMDVAFRPTNPAPALQGQDTVDRNAQAAEAAAGLQCAPAHVSPKFLYDALGLRLFDAITELPEYYPTRTERTILDTDGAAIAHHLLTHTGQAPVLVDLGAGNGAKAARLFPRLAPRRYVAVDIATAYLRESLSVLQRAHPGIEMVGVGQDFAAKLELPATLTGQRALVFYPGSSIGNFTPEAALRLLQEARAVASGGALLIGVDLVKPAALLEAAYDDALGVTAAFNLNLLRHLNALLGADFDVRQWKHVARYDAKHARVEMYLHACEALRVRWSGGERTFAAGERMHTENSYKWTPSSFAALLRDAGWSGVRHWTDAQGWFAVFAACATADRAA